VRETPEQLGLRMANTDKLLLICIFGMIIGFIIVIIDVQKTAYKRAYAMAIIEVAVTRGRNESQ
jgi:hypothetical protein